jgi:hypothetical protein
METKEEPGVHKAATFEDLGEAEAFTETLTYAWAVHVRSRFDKSGKLVYTVDWREAR